MKKNERLIEKKNLFVSFAHIFWSNDDIFVKLWTTEGLSVFLQGKHLALTEFGITMERNCWKKKKEIIMKKQNKIFKKGNRTSKEQRNERQQKNNTWTHLLQNEQWRQAGQVCLVIGRLSRLRWSWFTFYEHKMH